MRPNPRPKAVALSRAPPPPDRVRGRVFAGRALTALHVPSQLFSNHLGKGLVVRLCIDQGHNHFFRRGIALSGNSENKRIDISLELGQSRNQFSFSRIFVELCVRAVGVSLASSLQFFELAFCLIPCSNKTLPLGKDFRIKFVCHD